MYTHTVQIGGPVMSGPTTEVLDFRVTNTQSLPVVTLLPLPDFDTLVVDPDTRVSDDGGLAMLGKTVWRASLLAGVVVAVVFAWTLTTPAAADPAPGGGIWLHMPTNVPTSVPPTTLYVEPGNRMVTQHRVLQADPVPNIEDTTTAADPTSQAGGAGGASTDPTSSATPTGTDPTSQPTDSASATTPVDIGATRSPSEGSWTPPVNPTASGPGH